MRKLVVALLVAMTLVPASALAAGGKKPVIALSNSFYGNSWRKQMVDTMQEAAKDAKAKGLISDFVVANGDGTENTQIQQMSSLILQKVDAIVINAASLTGLNGVIAKAHQKGIKVIAFDSIVSSPFAYKIEYDNRELGDDLCQVRRRPVQGERQDPHHPRGDGLGARRRTTTTR